MNGRGGRVMFYVQHLLGVGHQVRAAAITRAMQARGMDVHYVSGGFDEAGQDLGGARRLQLPPARTADAGFSTLLDAAGQPVDAAWEDKRRRALLEVFESVSPDLLLIESFPFGRRRFRFELLPLLEAARGKAVIAASVRDILVERDDPERTRWIVGIAESLFDAVIVHGDPGIVEFRDTFAGADAIEHLIRYSGYVTAAAARNRRRRTNTVLVSAGGGAVGGTLLRTAIAARPLTRLADAPWRLVTGPNLPESDRNSITLPDGVTADTFIADFRGTLDKVAVSVSQAGYNTVMDLYATATPAVLVPFSSHGETEQFRRASILAERGHFQLVPEPQLTAETLARAIDRALVAPPPDPSGVDFNGAANTADIVASLIADRPAPPPLPN
ncbi:MAG: glycosyltransferase [Alphaproteobacteria bacterium]